MNKRSLINLVFSSTVAVSLAGCGIENEAQQSSILKVLSSKESHKQLESLNELSKLRDLGREELIEIEKIQKEIRQRLSLKSAMEFGRD